jgi:LmbE family N-acetylglucosaminyl deacetylase
VNGRVAGVFAHPDDDTYGVGGSIALHAADPGLGLMVIMTTSGDAGQIADPSLATRENLGSVREREDLASWRALGLEPEIHFLRHADGHVAELPREELVARYVELLLAARPDVVITFGPEGITGHEDHVAVGRAATEAFHAARASATEGFERLLYNAIPAARLDRFNEVLRERGMEPIDPTQPFQPRGVPDETIGISVDCRTVWERKLDALREHRTQGEMEDIPFDLYPVMLGWEEYVIAWPERPPGAPVLGDVFEGLPGA